MYRTASNKWQKLRGGEHGHLLHTAANLKTADASWCVLWYVAPDAAVGHNSQFRSCSARPRKRDRYGNNVARDIGAENIPTHIGPQESRTVVFCLADARVMAMCWQGGNPAQARDTKIQLLLFEGEQIFVLECQGASTTPNISLAL